MAAVRWPFANRRTLVALTAQDVARLADLARIELSEDELARLAPQLDVILGSVAKVAQAVGPDVPPTSHPVPMTNVFRADELRPSWPAAMMLGAAPDAEDGQFRVPRILEEEV
ncbi:MAG: Asp-tRNA(Asn)/Glu-tRNA(Gln) amidotransferase subunit GatC [Brooklawnia sp.]